MEHIYCSHLDRGSYKYAKQHGLRGKAGRAATATKQILAVPCPECESQPGAWCEYTNGRRPGAFASLHRARVKAAGLWKEPGQ